MRRKKTALAGLSRKFGKLGSAFLQRPGRNGFAGKEPIDFRKLVGIGVVRVVKLGDRTMQRCFEIGFVATVYDVKLLKVG